MIGLSKHVVNPTIFYDKNGFAARVGVRQVELHERPGRRVAVINAKGGNWLAYKIYFAPGFNPAPEQFQQIGPDHPEQRENERENVVERLRARDDHGAEHAMREVGVKPITLQAKEGLAMINGTQFMAAMLALGLVRARRLARAAEKAEKDAELNRRKQEKIDRRAKFAEIRQLVEQHQVPRVETEDNYNFQDGANIRRIAVTPQLRERLVRGAAVGHRRHLQDLCRKLQG